MRCITAYRDIPLLDIVGLSAKGDQEALYAFHANRTVFSVGDRDPVLFSDFVDFTREDAHRKGFWNLRGSNVVDTGCDLWMDRFSNLPTPGETLTDNTDEEDSLAGPKTDCRNYFRSAHDTIAKRLSQGPLLSALAREDASCFLLQVFVKRHFHYCMAEAIRIRNPLISRYAWKVEGHRFNLWFPKSIAGDERGKWLDTNVERVDPARPSEQKRIQALIDSRLGIPRLVSGDANPSLIMQLGSNLGVPDIIALDGEDRASLEEYVAAEKAASIALQLPAIRALGPKKLRAMVLEILESIDDAPKAQDKRLAVKYGLSASVYSRFAGSSFKSRIKKEDFTNAPHLWINISHVLANHAAFMKVARRTGMVAVANAILEDNDVPTIKREELRHE